MSPHLFFLLTHPHIFGLVEQLIPQNRAGIIFLRIFFIFTRGEGGKFSACEKMKPCLIRKIFLLLREPALKANGSFYRCSIPCRPSLPTLMRISYIAM